MIPDGFALRETTSHKYRRRTRLNVRDSDGTLILCRGELSGGTLLTRQLADRWQRPCLVVDPLDPAAIEDVRRWLAETRIATLNVAGPRESNCPGLEAASERFLRQVLGEQPTR